MNVTETVRETNVSYTVVANITNISDNIGYMYEAGFDAAHNIRTIDSVLGGASFSEILFSSSKLLILSTVVLRLLIVLASQGYVIDYFCT